MAIRAVSGGTGKVRHPGRIASAGSGGGGGGGTDPYFANVQSLLHLDGTDGSTTITDQIPSRVWTAASGASLSTAQKQFGTASVLIHDSTEFVFGDPNTAYNLGTGDFTWEVSIRPTTVDVKNIAQIVGSGAATSPSIYCLANGSLIYYLSSDRITSAAGVVVVNTWLPIAYSRVSGTGRLFANGVLIGSWADSTDYTNGIGNSLYLSGSASPLEGYYDEFRLTVGVGRYTASYTPAIAAFPNS